MKMDSPMCDILVFHSGEDSSRILGFRVVTPCSVAVGYQRSGGHCCLLLHPIAKLHGVITQKTSTWTILFIPNFLKFLTAS
jgi:hypothetical protein